MKKYTVLFNLVRLGKAHECKREVQAYDIQEAAISVLQDHPYAEIIDVKE